MPVSFSDIPMEALRKQLTQCLHLQGDIERLVYNVGASEDVLQLCQAAMMITMATYELLDNEKSEARIRIKGTVEQLMTVQSCLEEP